MMMITNPTNDVTALMVKFLKRKNDIRPNKSDGFYTTGTSSDSESNSDGSNSGNTSNQSGQN